MARFQYYRYGVTKENSKYPKTGFIRAGQDITGTYPLGIVVYDRTLTDAEIKRYHLVDMNPKMKNITRLRLNIGMRQNELSQITGISIRTIQGWELNGMNGASLGKASIVAKALNCAIEELVDDEEDE